MQRAIASKNWETGTNPAVLQSILNEGINIAICARDIRKLSREIDLLLERKTEVKCSGSIPAIMEQLAWSLDPSRFGSMLHDIQFLMQCFQEVTRVESFRLLLSTIESNMCRRFHADKNDVRMLCTYHGPGTLWLTEDNVNRQALHSFEDNENIVLDEHNIQRAGTGDIVLLKGSIFPQSGVKPAVHRSPTIEESRVQRLLLRVDTNETVRI